MALVRILVDGYSLLHKWPTLAPGKPRHSPAARTDLTARLRQYFDACGTPITIVFDGSVAPPARDTLSADEVEILYSRPGQKADQITERAAHRFRSHGQVLVVTDDHAERDTVTAFGAEVSSCENFIQTVENELAEMQRQINQYNERERRRFTSPDS